MLFAPTIEVIKLSREKLALENQKNIATQLKAQICAFKLLAELLPLLLSNSGSTVSTVKRGENKSALTRSALPRSTLPKSHNNSPSITTEPKKLANNNIITVSKHGKDHHFIKQFNQLIEKPLNLDEVANT